jgi:hypothetical protein
LFRTFLRKGGYQPGHVYELNYDAKGAAVAGLAFAALRDMASAVKNQLAGPIAARYVYAFGPSQDASCGNSFTRASTPTSRTSAHSTVLSRTSRVPRAVATSTRALRAQTVSASSWLRCFRISISISTIQ